jgi:hypothetical protein
MSLKDSHLTARRHDLKEDVLCVPSVVFRQIQNVFVFVLVFWLSSTNLRWFLLQDIPHHTGLSRGWVESNLIYARGAQIPVIWSSTCCNGGAKYYSRISTVPPLVHAKICLKFTRSEHQAPGNSNVQVTRGLWNFNIELASFVHMAPIIWRRRLNLWKICASLIIRYKFENSYCLVMCTV